MGMIDHEILFKVQHLRALKKLLLKDNLLEISKHFSSYEEKSLFYILQEVEKELKKYD